MPSLPDAMVPALKERMRKMNQIPEEDPLQSERKRMALAGIFMNRLIRRQLKKETAELPACRAAMLLPHHVKVEGIVLYLHGGGYCTGGLDYACCFGKLIAAIVKARTFCPAYRLAPEYPFPAALEDAVDAYRFLSETYPGRKICVIGESAGGGLLYALCVRCRELGLPQPAGLVAISPWTDLTLSGTSYEYNREADPSMTKEKLRIFARAYTDRPEDPLCSPLFADLSGLPESQIYVGGDEIMLEDSLRMTKALEAADIPVTLTVAEGFWHAYLFYGIRSRRKDNQAICEFLRSKLQ